MKNKFIVPVESNPIKCRLCGSDQANFKFANNDRDFYQCEDCDFLSVSEDTFLTADQEKSRYDQHRNNSGDDGYLEFLGNLKSAIQTAINVNMRGLDFGCGPSNTLANMFKQDGYIMDSYDPFYAPHAFDQIDSYDFITCCEVVEHFQYPAKEFNLLNRILRPNGLLAIQTNLIDAHRGDANWWYLRDRTHVGFYSRSTFKWIAKNLDFDVRVLGESMVVMQKL